MHGTTTAAIAERPSPPAATTADRTWASTGVGARLLKEMAARSYGRTARVTAIQSRRSRGAQESTLTRPAAQRKSSAASAALAVRITRCVS